MSSQQQHKKIKRSPLAKKLVIYMILFSATITLITTAIQLYNEYKRDLKVIELLFVQVEDVHLRSFTHSLWATNYQELKVQMEGLVTLPHVIYASVTSDNKSLVETGNVDSEHIIERHYIMEYEFLNQKHAIGRLTVTVTLEEIYAGLIRDAAYIFINNALRTLFVVIFIYFIFYHLITRHISKISQHFQKVALEKSARLVLDRESPREPDELDFLISSANEMQDRIIKAHKAYYESEKKYRTLTVIAPVGIFYTDNLGGCIFVNEKWQEITGMTEEEAQGSGWIKGLHPDDKDYVMSEWNKFTQQGKVFKLEYRFQKEGRVRWVLGQVMAEKNDANEVMRYVGTITDITERKLAEHALIESEEKLRIIHSQVPGIVYQFKIDTDGQRSFTYVSPAVESAIGISAEAVMKDASKWFDMTHPEDYPELEKTILESLVELKNWEWEGRFIRNDGDVVWLRGTSTPERMEDGSTIWNGIFVDVTERVRADEVIRSSQKMDALGKLTGGIAHDYNNMLGVVLGYSELLASRLEDQPRLQNYVNKISHAGERGAKLTKKLLAFSKNKSSDADVVSINKLLKNAQHMLEKTLTARIKLKYKLTDDCWLVYLDESELEDAILNMSINAMHAIDTNGELVIETNNVHINQFEGEYLNLKKGDYVQMTLSDTGHGMDESTREKIFDPFYTTKGDKGTGLGLSQVYGFVGRCGGAIKIESKIDQGTKFILYFPRNFNVTEKPLSEVKSERESLHGKETILVVDDELALLELINEILSSHHYQVFKAQSAQRALEILEIEKIDVLISDIIMPDMDGFELASIVKEKYPQIIIQLASGYSEVLHENHANMDLFESRLHKPYTAKKLLERIRLLLGETLV